MCFSCLFVHNLKIKTYSHIPFSLNCLLCCCVAILCFVKYCLFVIMQCCSCYINCPLLFVTLLLSLYFMLCCCVIFQGTVFRRTNKFSKGKKKYILSFLMPHYFFPRLTENNEISINTQTPTECNI